MSRIDYAEIVKQVDNLFDGAADLLVFPRTGNGRPNKTDFRRVWKPNLSARTISEWRTHGSRRTNVLIAEILAGTAKVDSHADDDNETRAEAVREYFKERGQEVEQALTLLRTYHHNTHHEHINVTFSTVPTSVADQSAAPAISQRLLAQDALRRAFPKAALHPAVDAALRYDPHCEAFLQGRNPEGYKRLGRNVELRCYSNVGVGGLASEKVTIEKPKGSFRFDRKLIDDKHLSELKAEAVRRNVPEEKDNGPKLSLVSVVPADSSDEALDYLLLKTRQSDYYSVSSVLSTLAEDDRLRHSIMSPAPAQNNIPHALCLHAVIIFSDGAFLLLHRSMKVRYEKDKVSFSLEEQFSPSKDFLRNSAMQDWIVRTLLEEVYPRRDFSAMSSAGETLRETIDWKWTSITSLFLEEKFGNFSLMAMIRLGINADEYKNLLAENNLGRDQTDREGRRYVMREDALKVFLKTGWVTVENLVAGEPPLSIAVPGQHLPIGLSYKELHSSSLMRMYRTAEILNLLDYR